MNKYGNTRAAYHQLTKGTYQRQMDKRYSSLKCYCANTGKAFNITKEDYQEALLLRTSCDCCGDFLPTFRDRKVDHDHSSGTLRGVLCHRCNTAEGLLRGIAGVNKMLHYLLGE